MTEPSSDQTPGPIPCMPIDEITAMVRARLIESTSLPNRGLVTLCAHDHEIVDARERCSPAKLSRSLFKRCSIAWTCSSPLSDIRTNP